jgi:hypothetical protein
MKCIRVMSKLLPIFLACGLCAAPAVAQSKTAGKPTTAPAAAPPIPETSVWRSLTTGRDYRVTLHKNLLVAEWVNLPPADVTNHASVRSELHRSGSKWVGTTRAHMPCQTTEAGKQVSNVCDLTTRIEMESIAADKIVGHGESLKRFNCGKCQILETKFAPFQWVRKK